MQRVITPDQKVVVLNEDGTWKYSSPVGSMLEKLKSLALSANIVEMFKGLFERLGVQVIDTGEAFTCIHHGNRIEFASGVKETEVDFIVKVYAFQLERLAEQVSKGHIDEVEQFRIARELFSSVSVGKANILNNPLMSNSVLRRVIRGKNLVHVHLLSPDLKQEENATFTLIYINERWLAIRGLHGEPKRVFRVSVTDATDLQKHLLAGMKARKMSEWGKIAKWYIEWRKKVEAPA